MESETVLFAARSIQRMLRLIAATNGVLSFARLHMCLLQLWFMRHFRPADHSQSKLFMILWEVLDSLNWWTHPPHLLKGAPFLPSQTYYATDHRCLSIGMGDSFKGSACRSTLVSTATEGVHQLHGTPSSQVCAMFLLEYGKESSGHSHYRQHDSDGVPELTRGNSVPQTLYVGHRHLDVVMTHGVYLTAFHVPGVDSVQADNLSRWAMILHEWELNWR